MQKQKQNAGKLKQKKPARLTGMQIRENLGMLWMVIPGLVMLIIWNYLPLPGTVIAFKKFNPIKGIWGSAWNGLDNFKFFFNSPDAFRVIRNTLCYGIGFLVLDLVCAVVLALMLYFLRSNRSLKVYNTIVILPRFMSSVVVAFIVYTILAPSTGVLNHIITAFGGDTVSWYTQPKYWPFILTFVHVWQTVGVNSIFYYSSLMSLDSAQLEAAEMDGASRWQQIIHVIIPHLVPIMIVTTILNIGSIIGGDTGLFNQVTKDMGVLYSTTDIINTYVYRALLDGNLAQSAAVNLFQSLVSMVLVCGANLIVKKISPENSIF